MSTVVFRKVLEEEVVLSLGLDFLSYSVCTGRTDQMDNVLDCGMECCPS